MWRSRSVRALAGLASACAAVVLSFGVAAADTGAPAPTPSTASSAVPAPTPTTPPSTPIAVPPAAPRKPPANDKGFCDHGIALRFLCRTTGDVASDLAHGKVLAVPGAIAANAVGATVGAVQDSVATSITHWVTDGAAWLLGKLGSVMDATTTPNLEADWFKTHYRTMVALATVVILPLLIASILGAVLRQDARRLARVVFGYLPLAGLFTVGAVSFVVLGLSLTDQLSNWVGAGTGASASAFLGNAAGQLGILAATPEGLFAVFLGALILAVGAVMIWLELLMRSAAIYVAVLFLPLALAGLVWPATEHWVKRLVHLLVAVILSKFVIVAVLSLAASGLAAAGASDGGGGFGSVLAAGALLTLAALSPLVLLRMAPIVEANLAASVGAGRASATARRGVAAQVSGGRSLIEDAQRWNQRDKTTPGPRTWSNPKPFGGVLVPAAAAAGLAGGVARGAGSRVSKDLSSPVAGTGRTAGAEGNSPSRTGSRADASRAPRSLADASTNRKGATRDGG